MEAQINLSSTTSFELREALLVYRTDRASSRTGSDAFVTKHNVKFSPAGVPSLETGSPLHPSDIFTLVEQLRGALPVEFLRAHVLVRTQEAIVWWAPSAIRPMFYTKEKGTGARKAVGAAPAGSAASPLRSEAANPAEEVLVLLVLIKVGFLSPPYRNCYGETCLTDVGTEGVAPEKSMVPWAWATALLAPANMSAVSVGPITCAVWRSARLVNSCIRRRLRRERTWDLLSERTGWVGIVRLREKRRGSSQRKIL